MATWEWSKRGEQMEKTDIGHKYSHTTWACPRKGEQTEKMDGRHCQEELTRRRQMKDEKLTKYTSLDEKRRLDEQVGRRKQCLRRGG